MSASGTKSNLKSVLIIDDDEIFRVLLKTFFVKLLPDVRIDFYDPVQQGAPASDFDWQQYDLLMMDYDLGNGENGLDWLRKYKGGGVFPATIMLTAQGNEEIAVEAMRFGAQDYINKTKLSMERLGQAVNNAVEKRRKQDLLSNTLTLQSNIFNKVHFYKKIKEVIENQTSDKLAFLLQIEINQYREIHEHHGLLAADNYITHITTAIAKLILNEKLKLNIVRMGDARVCCLIQNGQDKGAGEKIAAMICEHIKQPFQADEKTRIEASASIGIVVIDQEESVDTVLDRADRACHAAAEKGTAFQTYVDDARKRPVPAAPVTGVAAPAVVKATVDLAEIIKLNSIQPYFQPYIALSETAATFNASYFQMRMNLVGKDGKVFDAQEVRNMDIKNGNPGMLDLWATRYALAQILNMKKVKTPRNCGLFIRLFEESLRNNKLFEWMESLIKKTEIPNIASTVVFEIRPPEFLSHKENMLNFINQMRDAWGVSFALFDVINTSVLKTCIKQASFEFIKFTMNSKDVKTIAEVSRLASDLGALTIIEQIGSAQELNTAIELKFDYGQGDFIQPPMDQLIMAEVIEM